MARKRTNKRLKRMEQKLTKIRSKIKITTKKRSAELPSKKLGVFLPMLKITKI